jgi:serine/threonine-protein kinase
VSDLHDSGSRAGRVGLVGKTLGRYRISGELGRGGMATVYRAFDPQLSRDVAVKVMHGAFTGRGDIEKRFRREAQAVAALKHDSIVDVFDFAPGGDGEPAYIVSELVEGPTLRQLLERAGGRLPPEVAAIVASRVASALGAAHARGIVHRDVKPDNVMVDLRPSGVRVLLTDFGIARMTEDDTMTATGSILGSPAYMSPEQAKSGTIGPASDVFSLGVTLYQMIAGRTPFQGKDPLTVIAALVAGEFPRPSQLEARVAPELEAVILKCLKRVAAERYADGAAAHGALRELVAANAAVVGDEGAAVRAVHDDAAAFARAIGGPVAEAAVGRARACLKRGELSRALAQLNRALAYAPGHRGAEALLATISSRRRWVKVVAAVGALGLAGGAVAGVRTLRARPAPTTPVVAAVIVPAAAAPRAPSPPPPVVSPPALEAAVVAPPAAPKPAAPAKGPAKPAHAKRAAAPPLVTESPPPAVAAPEPAPEPVAPPPPPAPRVAPPPPTAGITLRARQGFCSPSLDDRPPALRPIYEGVSVGTHQIYCTVPGAPRVLAGTYELRAGTHPNVIVVPGADGRPTLARPE